MKPTWIFNFAKKDSVESFFAAFWKSVQQNSASDAKKLYYITDGFAKDFSIENTVSVIARNIVTPIGDNAQLIEGWLNNNTVNHPKHSALNLVFIGDITNEETQKNMHVLARMLRASLLDNSKQWTTADVRSYALLWRPKSAGVQTVSNASKAFLNELHSLMMLDINNRPFHKVLFFESAEGNEEKEEMIKAMTNMSLYLSLHQQSNSEGNRDILFNQDTSILYLNAGCAGVFYEKEVQREQEAYLLSVMLLDKLKTGSDSEFCDAEKAREIFERNMALVESLSPECVESSIKTECPRPYGSREKYGVDSTIYPLSLKLKEVWTTYYNKYVVNLKRNLVNRTRRALFQFAEDYKEKLRAERIQFINSRLQKIEDFVFEMFKDPSEHRVISIPQSKLLLEKLVAKLEEYLKCTDSDKFTSFTLPVYLEGAYAQAKSEHNEDENSVLAVLDGKLRNHPVFILSLFVRAIVLGAMMAYFVAPFFDNVLVKYIIGTVLFVAPILFGLWRFKEHVVRIDSLKDQYTACVLMRLQNDLNEELRENIQHVYRDLLEYCKWLEDHKLGYLENKLSAIKPIEFSFEESKYFKPLVNCSVHNGIYNSCTALNNTNSREMLSDPKKLSGSFGEYELLGNLPIGQIQFSDGNSLTISEIINDNKEHYKSKLLKELLESKTAVCNNEEIMVKFEDGYKVDSKLLILDVSGSMRGTKLQELKSVVAELERNSAQISWIAFNDKVVGEGSSHEEFQSISAGGYTNYVPALERAAELLKDNPVEKVIFISDGGPSESLKKVLDAAYKLNQPVHTISIGKDGRNVMRELAEKTNGIQIIVDDIKDISTETVDKLNVVTQLSTNGEYTFGEAMQKCYIPGCIKMLYEFSKSKTCISRFSMEDLIKQYGNSNGLKEWLLFSRQTCSHTQDFNPLDAGAEYLLQLQTANNDTEVVQKFGDHTGLEVKNIKEMPDILASILSLQNMHSSDSMSGISNLLWSGITEEDNSFSENFDMSLLEGHNRYNIHGKTI